MTVETAYGVPLSERLLEKYFRNLVNQIYKILPMREDGAESLGKYIWRLEAELIGNQSLAAELREDAYYGSLLGILHYLSENGESCTTAQVKQLVFEGINLCGKLQERYAKVGE